MVWACAKTEYQQTGNDDRKLEIGRVKKTAWKIEDDLEDGVEKDMNDQTYKLRW